METLKFNGICLEKCFMEIIGKIARNAATFWFYELFAQDLQYFYSDQISQVAFHSVLMYLQIILAIIQPRFKFT